MCHRICEHFWKVCNFFRAFENAIRSYEGDDPLDLWYQYISWVEQSYPKHGHEGNLGPLLESCLSKFEKDERYVEDRRFCKLWLKYVSDLNISICSVFIVIFFRLTYKQTH